MGVAGTVIASFGILKAIRETHRIHRESAAASTRNRDEAKEHALIAELRDSGREADAVLLEKLFADRDAVVARCRRSPDHPDAAHTLTLVDAIARIAALRAEEAIDLLRRIEDPLLATSEGDAREVEEIHMELEQAYQAVANARSRLRRGEALQESDFLAEPGGLATNPLRALTTRLEEETAVAKRIEERLRAGYLGTSGRTVLDDPVEPAVSEEERREAE